MTAERAARRAVLRWTHRTTRGLPEEVARDRVDQIVSDLWEHEHDTASRPGPALAAAILWRALRGVPADLAWRRLALARMEPGRHGLHGVRRRRSPGSRRRTTMSRKHAEGSERRPWVHLTDEKPFDQTNGIVDFDVEDRHDASNPERDLLEKGAASNMVNVGFGGGSF